MTTLQIPVTAVFKRPTGITQRPNSTLSSVATDDGVGFNLQVSPEELIRITVPVAGARELRDYLNQVLQEGG